MPIPTQLLFLFCYACAAAYLLFGVLQMVAPTRALPIYRFFLGRETTEKLALRRRRSWRLVGAGYIVVAMLVTLYLTSLLERLMKHT